MRQVYIRVIVSIVTGTFLLSSCVNDILEKEPVSSFSSENFYKTESDAEAGVYGIYDAAQGAFRTNFAYWGEGRADNVQTEQSGEALTLIQNNLNESMATADWSAFYRMISRANYAIEAIPEIFEEGDETGQDLVGQARALRALAYFYLVRVWGDVPLVTAPYTSIEENLFVEKSDSEIVLDQIEEDLMFASQYCRDSRGGEGDRIQFTKGGADALLTQVYMWRKKYSEALDASERVLDNPLYSLETTMEGWSEIFTSGFSQESIFEVGYNSTETNSLRLLYAIGSYAIYTPSAQFKASYELGDLRIDYVYDTTLSDPKAIWKFLGRGVSDEISDPSDQNIVLIRLADIMLLRAEALVQLGGGSNIQEALNLVNPIRERAGLSTFVAENDAIALYGDLESAILHERSIELCYEGHRWFDLVRTSRAIETMQPINGLSDEGNLVWPISVLTLNKNPNMVQNEYYQ